MNSSRHDSTRKAAKRTQSRLFHSLSDAITVSPARVGKDYPFDIVVLGGGMLGASFANWMYTEGAQKGTRVLLLEAGPLLLNDHVRNATEMRPASFFEAHEITPWTNAGDFAVPGLLLALGGRSLVWGAWSPIPTASELAEWPSEIRRDLYDRYLPFAANWLRLETDTECTGESLHARIRSRLFRAICAGSVCYSSPIADPGELDVPMATHRSTLKTYSPVPELLKILKYETRRYNGIVSEKHLVVVTECGILRLHASNNRIEAIETDQGTVRVGDDAAVVLATGAVESTRLALDCFPKASLIGRHLAGHVISEMLLRVPLSSFQDPVHTLQAITLLVRGCYRNRHFQIQLSAASVSIAATYRNMAMREMKGSRGIDMFDGFNDDMLMISLVGLAEVDGPDDPETTNRIVLKTHHGSVAVPIPQVIIRLSNTDSKVWDAMDSSIDDIANLFGKDVLYKVPASCPTVWQTERPSNNYIDSGGRRLRTLVHEGGTLRLGIDPERSVTDIFGRFHRSQNLYALGSAVFPTVGSQNGTLTAIALARRTAEFLLEKTPSRKG